MIVYLIKIYYYCTQLRCQGILSSKQWECGLYPISTPPPNASRTTKEKAMQEKVLVLHVKVGYEERAKHIESMLRNKQIPFEYITDGDQPDITEEILDRYFTGDMHKITPATSCALKHFYAYERILQNNWDGALILEDDMIFYNNFIKVFDRCMQECKDKDYSNILISFEDSSLHFVPRSQRKKGIHLYPARRDRFTGCLYISRECAQLIMNYVAQYKCNLPIDLLHKDLITKASLPYYWCHPTIATQGTHTGLYSSSICEQSARKTNYRKYTWKAKLAYKKLLYWLR